MTPTRPEALDDSEGQHPLEGKTAGDPGPGEAPTFGVRAYLIVTQGGATRVVTVGDGEEILLGRSRDAGVVIDDPRASRRHATLCRRGGELSVTDLGSRHGTQVRGKTLRTDTTPVAGGDVVRIGGCEVVVAVSSDVGEAPRAAAEEPRSSSAPPSSVAPSDVGDIVVADPASARLVEVARNLARTPSTVLITGETGVGKEVLARLIHGWSPRARRAFVRVNCAAIPETLVDSELFGYERGAFTGAERRKVGYLEAASGGTLLLDEIGELSRGAQAKLLSALENRVVLRVGGTAEIPVDFRLLCATHRDLVQEVAEGRFREDLYYRISTFTLRVPALRDRPAELPFLAAVFARRFAQGLALPEPRFSKDALALLSAHRWPGNARELRNAIEHAVVLADGSTIEPAHFPETVRRAQPAAAVAHDPAAAAVAGGGGIRSQVETMERRAIEAALAAEGGNQTRAAVRLGMSRRALTYKLAKYGIGRRRDG